jgi:hypothetical protein
MNRMLQQVVATSSVVVKVRDQATSPSGAGGREVVLPLRVTRVVHRRALV